MDIKSNKGVTLISFTIYLIILSIVIGIISMLQGILFHDAEDFTISSNTVDQHTRFLAYITNEINSGIIDFPNTIVTSSSLKFYTKDGALHQFLFSSGKLYYIVKDQESSAEVKKYITICQNISKCKFARKNENLEVSTEINGTTYINSFAIGT